MSETAPRRRWVVPAPPPRTPIPVWMVPTLMGERVIIHGADGGHHYGFRAWSELYAFATGSAFDVISEDEWWRWKLNGEQPRRVTVCPVGAAWVD